MDTIIFCRFISNSLRVGAVCYDETYAILEQFEKDNCFDKRLQPMYTANSLQLLLDSARQQTFYEITDYVNTSLLLFSFEDHVFLVGPYVKSHISDKELHEVMSDLGLSLSIFEQLKLYHSQYPLINYNYLTDIVLAAMRSFVPITTDYTLKELRGFHENIDEIKIESSADQSYLEVLERYKIENYFLEMITDGDVTKVMSALQEASNAFTKESGTSSLTRYANNYEGFTVLRTLTRKAAELGGCPVIKIDEITKRAIQKVNQSKSSAEVAKVQFDMIIDLTKAVAESKKLNQYSSLIRILVTFFDANYSREISLNSIAENSHVSKEHLCRLFKKETGVTITEYVATARCKKASELLTSTTLSIAEISELVGYHDNNYFVKVFKKYYEMTPSQYRNK